MNGTKLRVLTIGTGASGAVLIARPLTEMNRELSRILLLLAIVGVAGIALAAILGALVARVALAPVARFTARPYRGARRGTASTSRDAWRSRVATSWRGLAESFNTTLDALERSVEAQRQLIADAGHELRTPIASLRANIQVLGEAERLPEDEQESLRADIVSELDELTALVGDVVELARGSPGAAAPTRRAPGRDRAGRRRAHARRRGDLRFELSSSRRSCAGRRERIDRAVSNLLENAAQVEPRGGSRRGRPARGRAERPRPRAGLRGGGPAVRVRPLLPRRPRAQAPGLGPGPGDRAPGGRGLWRLRGGRQRRRGAGPC